LKDGTFDLELEHAMKITLINEMMEDEDINQDEEVDFRIFDLASFESVVGYCRLLTELPEPKVEHPLKEYWFHKHVHVKFQDYCKKEPAELIKLLKVADYLKMEGLINLIGL
jgi:hypothetical protein